MKAKGSNLFIDSDSFFVWLVRSGYYHYYFTNKKIPTPELPEPRKLDHDPEFIDRYIVDPMKQYINKYFGDKYESIFFPYIESSKWFPELWITKIKEALPNLIYQPIKITSGNTHASHVDDFIVSRIQENDDILTGDKVLFENKTKAIGCWTFFNPLNKSSGANFNKPLGVWWDRRSYLGEYAIERWDSYLAKGGDGLYYFTRKEWSWNWEWKIRNDYR